MAKQWNASSKRKREPCKLPRNAKILKQSVNLKRKRQVADVGGTPKAQRVSQAPQSNQVTSATKRRQKNRPDRGRKVPNDPNGCNASENPQYLGPYPVTNPLEKNPEPGSSNIPNNPNGPDTSVKPQYLGPYPVTSYTKVNTKSEPLRIPNNPKRDDAPENAQNIAAHSKTNVQKGKFGNGRPSAKFRYSENYPEANSPKKRRRNRQRNSPGNAGTRRARRKSNKKRGARFSNRQKNPEGVGAPLDSQNDCTHQVANRPEETSPKPQPESPKVFDRKEFRGSASTQTFGTSTSGTIPAELTVSLRKRIYQERPISRRYSTGELPVRDKLSKKFVMGIPKQRFGIGGRRDSTASAPPVMTAEYCGDPYRAGVRERLEAGEPRAPQDSEFSNNTRSYHGADKFAQNASRMHEREPSGSTKKDMAGDAAKAFNEVFKLRESMLKNWIGYDGLVSYLGIAKQSTTLKRPGTDSPERQNGARE